MKIVLLVPGAGAMYCGACARDAGLARALLARGHEVTVLPIYTPLRLEEPLAGVEETVYLGGISAFLRQSGGISARLAKACQRWLDRPKFISWASSFAVETNASDLAEMTVSTLQGPNGPHGEEMERAAVHVATLSPDVVMISNSMLLGLLPALSEKVRKPVVCGVTGEDGFLNELPEFWRNKAYELLRGYAVQVPLFLSPSESHADTMANVLAVDRDRFRVVRPVVTVPASPSTRPSSFVIGHLSSIRYVKGLDLLLDATSSLLANGIDLQVRVAGKPLEKTFSAKQRLRYVTQPELKGRVRFQDELSPSEKESFFSEISVMCLPSRLLESRAMVALESLARGVPVVGPRLGVFPELAELIGGIILHEPEDAESIASALSKNREAKMEGVTEQLGLHFSPEAVATSAEAAFQRAVH